MFKGKEKIFLLRNMKLSGLNTAQLLDAYKKEVRSLLELAVPVWNSGLTHDQIRVIERVQKSSLSAILGNRYTSYEEALQLTKLDKLSARREIICQKFIKKNVFSDYPLLEFVKRSYNTRRGPNFVQEYQCRKTAFFDSGLPYLARLYDSNI